jgi:hypothetical protein
MGGRMSGESPREEKLVERNWSAVPVRPYQTEDSGDTAMAIVATQASKQQLAV